MPLPLVYTLMPLPSYAPPLVYTLIPLPSPSTPVGMTRRDVDNFATKLDKNFVKFLKKHRHQHQHPEALEHVQTTDSTVQAKEPHLQTEGEEGLSASEGEEGFV
jgi:hypothetical protein